MTRIRLSLTRTLDIDLSDRDPISLGVAWAEQVLEALRDDDPCAQIETSDVDTLTGAIIRCIDADVAMTVADFEITTPDISVEILPPEKSEAEPKEESKP